MSVSYDGQGASQKRNHFTWILFRQFKTITVMIAKTLIFKIQLASHDTCEAEYRARVASYLRERQDAELQLGRMNIYSQESTAAATQVLSPRQRPIYLSGVKIGSGTSGTVYRALDASTGEIYAAKEFKDGCKFETEVEIHGKISHEHIVRFVDFSDEVRPLLVMEYLPGNLWDQDQQQIDPVAVLQQGLKALAYLHPRGIVHRDIKPANMLVKSLQPFHIKLADLGIATENSVLLTCCGTKRYAAPEAWEHSEYTSAVDIWSLGVVVFECAYGLPERGRKTDPLSWCRKIIRAVQDWDSDGLVDLLSTKMLKIDPQDRMSASGCLKEALDLNLGILNMPNFEVGDLAPTERMSTSLILRIVGIKKNTGDSDNDEEAETRILYPVATSKQLCREQLQTPAGAQTSKVRERQYTPQVLDTTLTSASLSRKRGPSADKSHGLEPGEQRQTTGRSDWDEPPHGRQLKRQHIDQPHVDGLSNQGEEDSHTALDTQILTEDGSGCIQMTVNGQVVPMRKSDFSLNVTQIIKIAGKTHKQRKEILKNLAKTIKIDVQLFLGQRSSWVCYEAGLELCQQLRVTEILKPLLDFGRKRQQIPQQTHYIPYVQIDIGDTHVYMRKADFRINATHISNTAGRARRELNTLRKSLSHNQFDIVKGGGAVQGTYVDVPTALGLCEKYGLDTLKALLQMTLKDHGYREERLSQQKPDANPIVPSSGTQLEGLRHSTPEDEYTAELPKAPSVFTEPSYTPVHPNLKPQEIRWIDASEIELGSPYGASMEVLVP